MEAATNPNNTNLFHNSLTLHIYKSILLFIRAFILKKGGEYFHPLIKQTIYRFLTYE